MRHRDDVVTASDMMARTQNSAGEGSMRTVLLQQLGRAAIGVDVDEEPFKGDARMDAHTNRPRDCGEGHFSVRGAPFLFASRPHLSSASTLERRLFLELSRVLPNRVWGSPWSYSLLSLGV